MLFGRARVTDIGFLGAVALGLAAAPTVGQSRFREPAPALPANARPYAAFDADGDQDLLTFRGLLLNDGGGRFGELPGAFPSAYDPAKTELAAPGDLDGDGDLDLVVIWKPSSTIAQAFYNDGTGVYSGGTWLFGYASPSSGGFATTLVLADFDGDGDQDVASSNNLFNVHLQTAPGVFTDSAAAIAAAAGLGASPILLGAVDLDGDGKTELICNVGGVAVVVRHTGVFTSTPLAGGFFGAPISSAVGDFDADGRRDLVVCRQVGAGFIDEFVFQPGPVAFAIGHARPNAARLGALDVDGDGDDDVLRCREGSTTVVDYATGATLNAPPVLDALPTGPTATPYAPMGPRFVVFDADGDGDDDVAGRFGFADYGVAFRTSAGLYLKAEDHGPSGFGSTAAADFDGDGDVDLARHLVAGGASAFVLYRNDGRGVFGPPSVPNPVLEQTLCELATGDFDADGLLDIVRFSNSDLPRQYRQVSPGIFVEVAAGTNTMSLVAGAAVSDYDGDGDPDVLIVGAGGTPFPFTVNYGLHVLVNNGGLLAPPVLLAPFSFARAAPIFADADGVADFVVTFGPTGVPAVWTIRIYSGATGLLLYTPGVIPAATGYQGAVAVGDLNGDGAQDVVAEGTAWQAIPGGFVPVAAPPIVPLAPSNRRRFVQDVDVDGVADVVEISTAGGAVWFGLAGGGFSAPELFAPDFGVAAPVFADFDRDGDPDLIDATARLRLNTTAQIAPGHPAIVGTDASFDVCGLPGAPFDLFASLAAFTQNPVVIPGWGNLWLDPSQAVYVGSGSLDPTGRREIKVTVPNVGVLVGLTFYWQAALPATPRLTNAHATKVYAP